MSGAFRGDGQLQVRLLAGLTAAEAAQRVTPQFMAWDGHKGSVVGCLLESESLANWPELTGLPRWLALVIDLLAASTSIDAEGAAQPMTPAALGNRLLAAIRPGADLDRTAAALAARLLQAPAFKMVGWAAEPALQGLLRDVADLHQQVAAGTAVDGKAWRTVRRAATALTDTLPNGVQSAIGASLEAACWDPAESDTMLSDAMRAWLQAIDVDAGQRYGWSPQDDVNVRARLDALFAEASKTMAPEEINVFALYEQRHAEEAARTRGRFAHAKQARAEALLTAMTALEDLVR